jgi:murein DD-endopeptidase MepM/ murein hydrolase activator NlpD
VWGTVITIEHTGLNQRPLWTRYAHVEEMTIKQGDLVLRGEPIARVGNADGRYPYHLHYDVAVVDLGKRPGDWPGDDLARVQRDYLDPLTFMVQQSGDQDALPVSVQVFAQPSLNIRAAPNATSKVIGWLPQKSIVVVVEKTHDNWGRILQDAKARAIDGWIALWWTKGI